MHSDDGEGEFCLRFSVTGSSGRDTIFSGPLYDNSIAQVKGVKFCFVKHYDPFSESTFIGFLREKGKLFRRSITS